MEKTQDKETPFVKCSFNKKNPLEPNGIGLEGVTYENGYLITTGLNYDEVKNLVDTIGERGGVGSVIKNMDMPNMDRHDLFGGLGPMYENCNFLMRTIRCQDRSGGYHNCNMRGCTFYDSQFHDMRFLGCDLSYAKYLDCQVDSDPGSVTWGGCKLDYAKFRFINNNDYDNVRFLDCSMKGTDMRTCDFSRNKVTIDNCETDDDTKFAGMKVKHLDATDEFRSEFIGKGGIVEGMTIAETVNSMIGRFKDVITPEEKSISTWLNIVKNAYQNAGIETERNDEV